MKNLVISAIGDDSLHDNWLRGDYDTALIYYGDKNYSSSSKFFLKRKGFKYHLIKDFIDNEPKIKEYDYIWLPDDDVYLTSKNVEKLFHIMKKYDLWLAQPSILGWFGTEVALNQKGSFLRYTNWVEIMCPCFSKESLNKCSSVFKENNGGWSFEGIWNYLLDYPTDKIAIIDDIIAIHTKKTTSGSLYQKTNPENEGIKTYNKWKLGEKAKSNLAKGKGIGGEVYCATLYGQIFKGTEGSIPRSERFYPDCDYFKELLENISKKKIY